MKEVFLLQSTLCEGLSVSLDTTRFAARYFTRMLLLEYPLLAEK